MFEFDHAEAGWMRESAIDISKYYINTSVKELWTTIKYLSGLSWKINRVGTLFYLTTISDPLLLAHLTYKTCDMQWTFFVGFDTCLRAGGKHCQHFL